ncbi:DUF2188 domain-containing protein [Flagellimonas onchidii]|uniref:DUF2188 domain-containing protein n=1 Tax=Flagellimonas onchidii TaxID=2562684 RepID=UPI0010A62E14|nr:DUF2188 domain-containing protein [Allomuricauda onchidii]
MSTGKSWLRILIELIETFINSKEGNKRITSKHRKQSTAIRKAKSLAKKYKADVIIHRASGGIRERISYED